MIKLSLFAIAVAVLLCSCKGNNHDKIVSVENPVEKYFVEDDEELGWSHFSDTLTSDEYHQMILDAIAEGKKELFSEMISYPLNRKYPLHDIEDKQQMIRYFDTLFDIPFRKQIAKLDASSWECIGWRGYMILNGEIWDTDPCIVINYSSPLEQSHAKYLADKDIARLHPSLRGNWRPFECYYLDGSNYPNFSFSYARIDANTNSDPRKEPDYRLSLFKKGSKASDAPFLVLMGTREIAGTLGIETFYFKSEKYYICINPRSIEDGKSYFDITINGEKDKRQVVPCKSKMQPF